ncbi:MAG TPA: hypothetical protein VFR37_25645 [Longimicrobium sp.]|nr:hypothetical protein [Longimicrobium sp.]
MNKLTLRIDELAVESFPTAEIDREDGTVHGQEMVPTPPYYTCPPKTRLTDCPCTPVF